MAFSKTPVFSLGRRRPSCCDLSHRPRRRSHTDAMDSTARRRLPLLDPGVAGGACERQARDPALLAAFDNSEDKARAKAGSDPGFECMLQRHAVPVKPASTWPGGAAMGPIEVLPFFSGISGERPRRSERAGRFGVATLAT